MFPHVQGDKATWVEIATIGVSAVAFAGSCLLVALKVDALEKGQAALPALSPICPAALPALYPMDLPYQCK